MKQILRMTGLIRPLLLMLALLLFGNARGWAETVTYKLTIDTDDFNTTSYAANNIGKTTDAICTTDATKTFEVKWRSNQIMLQSSAMQWQKSTGCLYNTTDLGTITEVNVTSSAGTFTTYYGTSEKPDASTTVGGGFFQVKVGNATGKSTKVEITFTIDEGNPNLTTSDLAITSTTTALSFDLYNNANAQTISYTTSSTGAVTVSGGEDYVTTSVDATNKTITVTPTAVTHSAQTITISQAADDTYAAGSATFTVSVDDSTPTHTATFSVNGQTTTQDFEEGAAITFPANPADVDDKTFWGWTSEAINGTTDEAPTKVTSATMGESNVTYYAVFATKTEDESASYTLEYANEPALSSSTDWGNYGTSYRYTASDGGTWTIKAYKSSGMQINAGRNSSIKVPNCAGYIQSIEIKGSASKAVGFSAEDYFGSSTLNTFLAEGTDATSQTLDLSAASVTGGYIVPKSGNISITKIVVNYLTTSYSNYCTTVAADTREEAGIAFNGTTNEYTANLYGEFEKPALENSHHLAITYSSSNTDVATVDASTGAVTLVGVGVTTISAVFEGNDDYKPATVSYTLTVADNRQVADLAFTGTTSEYTANLGEAFSNPELSAPQGVTITYSSSNTAVATVDASTGAVTLVAAGETTITATSEANNNYKAGTASYTLTVVDPNAPGTQNNPYTVAQALANTPASGTSANVYIKGIVSAFNKNDIMSDGSNYRYYISDDGTTTNQLLVYKGKGLNNVTFSSANDLQIGDEVVILGGLTTFSNAPEVAANNYIVSLKRTVTCATPTFTPEAGAVVSGTGIGINCATEGATIYYTTDGSTPTTSSNVYSATFAITIDQDMTIKAIAVKEGCVNSEVAEASYTIARPCATPTFSVAGGTFTTATTIDFRCDTEGATIYYSFNGEDWYEGASYVVTSSTTLYIKATKAGMVDSEVASATFTMRIPTITLNSKAVRVTAAGDDGTIAVTYNNITEVLAEVKFYEADGSTEATYDWLEAEIDNNNNVTYIIGANTSNDERKAYMKVYALDDTSGDVYSELITITQAGYVVDYAALPFEFDGGKGNLPTGLTQSGLGSDYSASPCLKFDTTGDNLILKLNEAPGTLTFDIKGNSFSGGTFKVQTSADGETYADLESYTELGDTQSEEFDNLSDNVRYIKWIYTTKSSGNVALGNIKVAKASTDPTIALSATSIDATAAEADGTITVTYKNFTGTSIIAEAQMVDADGNSTQYAWIKAEISENDNTQLDYHLIEANESTEARTAYMKVYAISDNDEAYSSLITITQAGKVIDYATLPFEFDGKKADIGKTNGLTQAGLGSDYSASPCLKFDGTDDVLVLKTEGGAAVLSFDIKGNSFSGGTFTVQTSTDGTEYTDLNTYNELDATTTERFDLGADVHYIKWIYTEKDNGNVALGNIKVNKPEAVTVTAAGYATYCSENALSFEGTGIKAYVGTLNGTELTFTPITKAPANTGLLLVAEGGKTANAAIIAEAEAAAVTNNCLTGVTAETTLSSEDYILNVKEAGAGFYKAGDYTTLGANRAYIAAQQGGQVKGFVINLNGDLPTGVAQMDGEKLNADDAAIFNLSGQRMSKPQKGVNIVNGKKVLVK